MENIDNKQIILVGNGPSVLQYEVGSLIDQFETVVRFNNYPSGNYEKHVGVKEDIWARNNALTVIKRDPSPFRQILIVAPEWNYNNVEQIASKYGDKAIILPREYAQEIQEQLHLPGKHARGGRPRAWPTTGIITLYYYLHQYSVIYIHGFDHFEGKNHYFDKEKMLPFIQFAKKAERVWVESKIAEGRVRRLVTPSA